MTNATPQAAAGWYPDPELPGTLRWWDGSRWTADRLPQVPSRQVGNAAPLGAQANNGTGTAALVLGLSAILSSMLFNVVGSTVVALCAFCVAALAVIFGILGAVRGTRLKRAIGRAVGRGMSITGIVLGGLFVIAMVASIIRTLS